MMEILVPQDIPAASVLASPPELHPEYVAGTYTNGARVVYGDRVWESVVADNSDDPVSGSLKATPTWIDAGPSNKMAAFDQRNVTRCVRTDGSNLVLRFKIGAPITALYLFAVTGSALTVRFYAEDGTTLLRTESPAIRSFESWSPDWWDFFFTPWISNTQFGLIRVPASYGMVVEIDIAPEDGRAELGEAMVGVPTAIGRHKIGLDLGISDYSQKETDEFGDMSILKRETAPRRVYNLHIEPHMVATVEATLRGLTGTKTVFIVDSRLPALTVLGVLGDSKIGADFFFDDDKLVGSATAKIEVQGVTG